MNLNIHELRELLDDQKVGVAFLVRTSCFCCLFFVLLCCGVTVRWMCRVPEQVGGDAGGGFHSEGGVEHATIVWSYEDVTRVLDEALAADRELAKTDPTHVPAPQRDTPGAMGRADVLAGDAAAATTDDENFAAMTSTTKSNADKVAPTPKKIATRRGPRAKK